MGGRESIASVLFIDEIMSAVAGEVERRYLFHEVLEKLVERAIYVGEVYFLRIYIMFYLINDLLGLLNLTRYSQVISKHIVEYFRMFDQ